MFFGKKGIILGGMQKWVAFLAGNVYTKYAALCGELAVPCNLQSATARQNAYRGIWYGRLTTTRSVDTWVLCNDALRTMSGLDGSSIKQTVLCATR